MGRNTTDPWYSGVVTIDSFQCISMAKGGARPGAGRPRGIKDKPHIAHYWTEDQIVEFFESMYKRQKKDPRIAIWCGDQLSGKAPQAITGPGGGALVVTFDNAFIRTPKEDS